MQHQHNNNKNGFFIILYCTVNIHNTIDSKYARKHTRNIPNTFHTRCVRSTHDF